MIKDNTNNKLINVKNDLNYIVNTKKRLYLYGNGNYSEKFKNFFLKKNRTIQGCVVSIIADGSDEENNVISVEELNELNEEVVIVLALSEMYHDEVKRKIKKTIEIYPSEGCSYAYQDVLDYLEHDQLLE